MNARCFSAPAVATVALALRISFALPALAQQAPAPDTAPSSAGTATQSAQVPPDIAEILKLAHAKVSDDVIVAFIQNGNRGFDLTAAQILYLRQEGLSDRVLATMLSQPRSAAASATSSAWVPESNAAAIYAPQAVAEPATVVQTVPTSTVYVAPSYPVYYPLYNPWPGWYDPWPYWGWGATFSFGFFWGNWGNNCDNNYCCYKPPPPNGGRPPPPNGGQPPPPDGATPRPPSGSQPPPGDSQRPPSRTPASVQPGTLASSARPPAGVSQPPSTSEASQTAASSTPSGRPTSIWNTSASRPATSSVGGSRANAASSRSSQSASPTSHWGASSRGQAVAASPSGSQGVAPSVRGNRNSSPTSVWSGSAARRPASYAPVRQNAASVARPSSVSARPATSWSRPSVQPTSRYLGSRSVGFQRSSIRPTYSYRATPSFSSASRPTPSMASSMSSRGSRSAPRVSSGGGFHGRGGGHR